MTAARPVGLGPTGPASILFGLSRGGAFSTVGVLASLNAQADQIISTLSWQPLLEAVMGMAGISAVIWAAMAAAWKIGSEDSEPVRRPLDLPVLGVVLIFSFIPVSYAAQAGLLLCGGYLLATTTKGTAGHRAALVLLVLTGPLLWGRLFLHLFEGPLLALDAHLVAASIGTEVHGNLVTFAGSDRQFLIGGPCSSVHNMSLAIVLWTTAAMLFRIRIDRKYIAVGVAMAALMYALNVMRLSAIGLFPRQFDYLHFGGGAALFGWAGLLGAALLAGLGVIHAAERQR